MNDSFNIEKGLRIGRKLLLELNEMGLPCATEALDPNSPQLGFTGRQEGIMSMATVLLSHSK
jgi:phospho-2-dehydro-3-deoxyheptonate aldolase